MGELLLDPVTRNGRFLNDYVESEKQNLIDAIRGIINDKRDYADLRLLQEMCRGERYGVDKFGSIARVEKITNQNFVPVVDDNGIFIGIVTRKDVLLYLAGKLRNH